jgi:small subunit ribosomal protein S21
MKNTTRISMRDNQRKIRGTAVILRENDDVFKALKKFKNKVEDSNKLKDLQKKEFYEKPTTVKKRKAGAAKSRWQKKLRDQQLPPKLF